MIDWLDAVLWWVGLLTCLAALVAGATTWGMVFADWLLRQLGLWPDFMRAMRIMWRERSKQRDKLAEQDPQG